MEIELGGVQVYVASELVLIALHGLYLTAIHLCRSSCAVVVAQLVALIVAGTVHRVCITTWYVTLKTLHCFYRTSHQHLLC